MAELALLTGGYAFERFPVAAGHAMAYSSMCTARCAERDDECVDGMNQVSPSAWRKCSMTLKRRWIEPGNSFVVQTALQRAEHRSLLRRATATSLTPAMLEACLRSVRALQCRKVLILGNVEDERNNSSVSDMSIVPMQCGNFAGPLSDSATGAFARRVPIDRDSYWYRELADGTPQLSLVDPLSGWKSGVLPSGQEYFYNTASHAWDGDDIEVKMVELHPEALNDDQLLEANEEEEEEQEGEEGVGEWQVGTLASGMQYMWRSQPSEPEGVEVRFFEESMNELGDWCWCTVDSDDADTGDVTSTDPREVD